MLETAPATSSFRHKKTKVALARSLRPACWESGTSVGAAPDSVVVEGSGREVIFSAKPSIIVGVDPSLLATSVTNFES